ATFIGARLCSRHTSPRDVNARCPRAAAHAERLIDISEPRTTSRGHHSPRKHGDMTATMDFIHVGQLRVAKVLHAFIEREAVTDSGISSDAFWSALSTLLREFGSRNRELLRKRDELQQKIDEYHQSQAGQPLDQADYERFLRGIGYVESEPAEFSIRTADVDAEIAYIAGPQLVVPVSNARYAVNAANARWGSLYDALYGTDAIPEDGGATRGPGYNAVRGARVVAKARQVLDQAVPLAMGSHRDAAAYVVENGRLAVTLSDPAQTGLAQPAQLSGVPRASR